MTTPTDHPQPEALHSAGCCSPSTLQTCCAPTDKQGCCGRTEQQTSSCGCQA
jgi:hypothetical protein